MKVERKPKETNQQLIRRFTRDVVMDGRLDEFKERQYFIKPLSRNMRRKRATKSAEIAAKYGEY